MSGIAEVLINQGFEVTGSDMGQSSVTEHLKNIGANIMFNHHADNVEGAQVVVASSAIRADNVEVVSAKEKSIPVIPRAEMLAELMRMKYGIAIAGTHGKTTTTSLVATVLAGGGLDPTVVIGGRIKSFSGLAKLGQSEFLVAEADESDGSFLKLSPTFAVVTTLDEEHMEHFKTLENIKNAFLTFINKTPFFGASILCLDDPNIQSLIPKIKKRYITYGLTTQADYTARNISVEGLQSFFTVYFQGKELGRIHSGALGRHNVLNTLAAVAVGMELNLEFSAIANSLKDFPGVQRRFEIVHESDGLTLVDDYGHHPVEIQATLKTAKEVWPDRKLIAVFQPHRYTRTQSLLEQFCSAFNDADQLIVMDIYPAGETPIPGVHARQIADGARKRGHKNAAFIKNRDQIVSHLLRTLNPGDVVITLGAGDVGELDHILLTKISN